MNKFHVDSNQTLPCGVGLHVQQREPGDNILVSISDPTAGSFAVYDNGKGLVIAIRETNVKKLREIFDLIDPQPKPAFGTNLREAWQVLKKLNWRKK